MRVFELATRRTRTVASETMGPNGMSFSLSADGAGVAYDFGDGLHARSTGLSPPGPTGGLAGGIALRPVCAG